MESITLHRYGLNFIALLLLLPSAWLIGVNLLNEAGIDGPYNSSYPFFKSLGIQEQIGWNINLLIVCGPVIALLLAASQVLHINRHFSKEQFQFNIFVKRKWLPLFITFFSGLILAILFFYLVGENM
jgi:hypothetical protein